MKFGFAEIGQNRIQAEQGEHLGAGFTDLPNNSEKRDCRACLPDDSGEKVYNADLPDDTGESLPQTKDTDEVNYYYDDRGQLYRIGDKLIANTSYELNGYSFATDELGRVVSAEGQLHMKNRDERLPIKDSLEVIGKGDQREGDDRGHLIGDQFDGPNGLENLVPQDAEINRKDFKNFENELAGEVKAGKDVYVKIDVLYDEGSRRPTNMMVSYLIDENEGIRIFPNGPREV